MMKRTILLLAVGAMALACSKNGSGGAKLRTDTDSVAYVLGFNIGLNLQRMDSTLNAEAVCEGIRDVFRPTRSSSCSTSPNPTVPTPEPLRG